MQNRRERWGIEPGGWLIWQRRMPRLDRLGPAELLDRGATLPAWFRFTRARTSGGVVLTTEVRHDPDGALADAVTALRRRLAPRRDVDVNVDLEPPDAGWIEAILAGSSASYSRRDSSWAVPAQPRELLVRSIPGAVCVEVVIATWDEIAPSSFEALAAFLLEAQSQLRCARCVLSREMVRVAARLERCDIEAHFQDVLQGVAAGARLLAKPAEALLDPVVAGAYLRSRRGWGNAPSDRSIGASG